MALNKKKASETTVEAYMHELQHPLMDAIQALRSIICAAHPMIIEEIKWNAPAFFYSGELKPSLPKEFKKYLVVFNFSKKGVIRLVFMNCERVSDSSGLLFGDYTDGRRLAQFESLQDVEERASDLTRIIRNWIAQKESEFISG